MLITFENKNIIAALFNDKTSIVFLSMHCITCYDNVFKLYAFQNIVSYRYFISFRRDVARFDSHLIFNIPGSNKAVVISLIFFAIKSNLLCIILCDKLILPKRGPET